MAESGHGLGPHVVGQRVVVRRILPGLTGPSGGPALTDVLGVCESWADGIALIRTADGVAVPIEIPLIVSGKPVPPRPSVRSRVSTRDAESHGAPLWTGIVREALGEWELRSEPEPPDRLRKRTNSVLAIGDPGLPFGDALVRVRAFYADRDRPALVQVEADGDLERAFLQQGWTVIDGEALFLLGSTSRVLRSIGPVHEFADLSVDGPRLVASTPEGAGKAGIDGDWIGLHDLYVEEGARHRGVATRLIRTLLEAGAEQGATTTWLHVETANVGARALYERLGFTEHHRCRYLSGPS